MSVIQSIRDKGAWIVFGIIALALIAFILQDGMRRNTGRGNVNNIAVVNGDAIEKTSFDEKVDMTAQNYAGQGVKREQIVAFQFNQEVDNLLIDQETQKLGIIVGNKELSDVLFGNESPFRNEFTDKTTGEFKVNDAKTAIANIKKSKNADQIKQIEKFYIEPSIQNRIRGKYQAMVVRGVQMPKWLTEKSLNDNNAVSSISYVGVPYTTISDSSIKVSNDDIAAYLKAHENSYQNEEASKSISYVGFSAAPTSADTAATFNQVLQLKEEFKNTKDDAAFLNKVGSDIPFYNSYVSKSRLQIANKDSVLAAGVGNVYGPYLDVRNFSIAKVLGVKQWPDSASVRHILIAAGQTRSDSVAKKLADSIKTAIAGGANFEEMVQKYSDDQGSKAKGGVYPMFPQAQMVGEFNDFSFDNPVGTKSVVKTEFGYHYIEILKQTERKPAYKIAYLSKQISASSETINAASTAAAKFVVDAKDQKSFIATAVKEKKQVFPATNIKANDLEIPGVGESRTLVRWITENKIDKVSEPIEVGENYVIAVVTAEEKKGLMSVESAKGQIEGFVRDQKKAEQIKKTFKGSNLEALAAAAKTTVQKLDTVLFSYNTIPGIGNEPKVVGAAFNKALLNKVSEPISGNNGVFAITVHNLGANPAAFDVNAFKDELLNRARSAVYRTNVGLKKAAKIEDNRFKIY
jgi:peptidyl-prolyl cis-trans isomerase D